MRKTVLTLSIACMAQIASAQAISTELINKARTQKLSASEKAIRNAMGSTEIKKLAVNQDNAAEMDTYFSDEVSVKGITDQKSSGRCWLFTGMNVLRSKVIADNKLDDFRFSQVYLFFWDQFEKSNLFLQGVIDTRQKPMTDKMVDWLFSNPLSDGGTFTGVADLTAKYGVVPQSVMPETYIANHTSAFSRQLKSKLREFGMELRGDSKAKADKLIKRKEEMLLQVYKMLVMAYGEPPVEFDFAFKDKNGKLMGEKKHYTPQSFYKEVIGDNLTDNYIMLMNDPSHEYWKTYEIDFDRHTYDGHNWLYLNLPIEEIKKAAIASIKDGKAMYFSCDVGKFLDSERGLLDLNNYDYGSLFGTTFGMDKEKRVKSHDSGSSHAMTLVAVDLDEKGNSKKWKVENSWGASSGHKGYLIMTDEWFNEYMFRLVINKKYATDKMIELSKTKPIFLPAWDPMFAGEE